MIATVFITLQYGRIRHERHWHYRRIQPIPQRHAYQIAHVRKNLHADYIVVATSGDYVQRGEPALLDKYTRARMALSSGADVVLELPVLWSTASAELSRTPESPSLRKRAA